MAESVKMLIGGEETGSSDGAVFEVMNPATHRVIATVPSATRKDCERALDNARKGFEEWSAVPLYKRIEIMKKSIAALEENREEIAGLIVEDLGVPACQVQGEIATAIARATAAAEGASFLNGETVPPSNCAQAEGDLIMTTREPLGVVLAIIPFNFTIGTYSSKIWPALLMGNAVIIKAPSDDPLAIIRMAKLMIECGVPGNALQVITGKGEVLGTWLNKDARLDAVSMTGSTAVGGEVASAIGANIGYCALELGGNDPLIVLGDADVDYAVSEAFAHRSNRSGQICHSSKRIIVHESIYEEFKTKLVSLIESKKIGDPADMDTTFGPLISPRAAQNVKAQIDTCVSQGAKILTGGKLFDETFVEPTVLECTEEVDSVHDLEIFGPVWSLVRFGSVDEALKIANATCCGLCSGVIGKDVKTLMKVAKNIQAGTCVINGGGSYAPPYSPFGGYKRSGLGRQSAMENLREFSQLKTIVFRRMY